MSDTIVIINGTRHTVWRCRTCGVDSTCPEAVYEEQRDTGGYHYCPNGHSYGWSKQACEQSRAELKRERDRLKQNEAYLEDRIRAERERAEKAEAATKRLKKRAAAGTCPCCKRTFSNMAEHMKTQHPELICESGANVVPIKRGRAG